MKHHVIGTYPMYLTEKIHRSHEAVVKECTITLYSVNEINVGDKYDHVYKGNTFNVSEVIEKKYPAKGNHKTPVFWYKILLTR